nr:tail-anchored protein insertion receptor WRB [Leptinotarsa decemlineata]
MFLLILSTVLSFITVHTSIIGKLIFKWRNRPSSEEMQLISQKKELLVEQSQYNITENFAKYSKVQRKINKIEETLAECHSKNNGLTMQIGLTYGLKILFGFTLVLFSLYFRHTPVFTIDKKIDMTPFSFIISYPNGHNIVSFHFWSLCCTSVAKLIKL